jgi:hypothetical protein
MDFENHGAGIDFPAAALHPLADVAVGVVLAFHPRSGEKQIEGQDGTGSEAVNEQKAGSKVKNQTTKRVGVREGTGVAAHIET